MHGLNYVLKTNKALYSIIDTLVSTYFIRKVFRFLLKITFRIVLGLSTGSVDPAPGRDPDIFWGRCQGSGRDR
jgi:hypothetical protein